jgi:hypothetical protein
VNQLEQVEHSDGVIGLAHKRHAGDSATGIELEAQRLERADPDLTIHKADNKRHDAMHAGAATGKQQSRALFIARHERFASSIQHKHSHGDSFNNGALTGLVTLPLREVSPRRCCTAGVSALADGNDPFRAYPIACLQPFLPELGTEEACQGGSAVFCAT